MVGKAGGAGLRERKRRETLQRITDVAMGLFVRQGYVETTLDEIAAAAGISRRTFFYYFKSKDDILLSVQSGLGDTLVGAIRDAPPDVAPLHAIRDALIAICAPIPAEDMIVIDRLMRSSAVVQARKQAGYVEQETALLAALRERWPDPQAENRLRMVAMMAIGAMRLAFDTFNREGGRRPVGEVLHEMFAALDAAMA